jgi:hypothetical protein
VSVDEKMNREPNSPKRRLNLRMAVAVLGVIVVLVCVSVVLLLRSGGDSSGPKIVLRESADAQAALQPRIVDEIKTGSPSSESAHKLRGAALVTGPFMGNLWRGASFGGYIHVTMKVLPDKPVILNCRYWGSEEAPRKFDILVQDQVIATQELEYNVPGHFFDVEYKIPQELTRGRNEVEIEFRGHPGAGTGGFFGIHILKQ